MIWLAILIMGLPKPVERQPVPEYPMMPGMAR